jgi:chromosome segregation ATPase
MTISDTDLAHIEVTAGLTLHLVAELRRAREMVTLRTGEIAREAHEARQARERLLVAVRELDAANARIRELEEELAIERAAERAARVGCELETLRAKVTTLETVRVAAGAFLRAPMGTQKEDAALDALAFAVDATGGRGDDGEPATVKP